MNRNHIKIQKLVVKKSFAKKNLMKNMLKKQNVVKFGIIAIMQGNTEVLLIVCIIQSIVYLKKFLQLFLMDLTMITILAYNSQVDYTLK